MSIWLRAIPLVLLAAFPAACGVGEDPPSAPTPIVRTLRFTPSSPSGENQSYWLTSSNQDVATLAIDINARFSGGVTGCAPSKFRGTLVFDDNLVRVLNYSDGTLFQQGGAVVTTSVTTGTPGRVVIHLDRPDSTGGVTGQGIAITLRFQAKGQSTGTTPLQWTDTNAYTPSFSDCLLVVRNASIAVQ